MGAERLDAARRLTRVDAAGAEGFPDRSLIAEEKAVKQPERLGPCADWWGARVHFRSTADHLGVWSAKRFN